MEINKNKFQLITEENGNCIVSDDKILLQRIEDGALVYVDSDVVIEECNLSRSNEENYGEPSSILVDTSIDKPQDTSIKSVMRSNWSREEILQLIQQFKENRNNFKSTTIKNEKVWQNISKNINTHTWEQCKNKFKYLKSKYIEKKDNMGPNASGSKNIKFEYFKEMEELFGKEPNVKPVAVASSSKGLVNLEHIVENKKHPDAAKRTLDQDIVSNKRFKTQNDVYRAVHEMKETGRNQRHQENLVVQRELVNVLKELVNCLKK